MPARETPKLTFDVPYTFDEELASVVAYAAGESRLPCRLAFNFNGREIDVDPDSDSGAIVRKVRAEIAAPMLRVSLKHQASPSETHTTLSRLTDELNRPLLVRWNSIEFEFGLGSTMEDFTGVLREVFKPRELSGGEILIKPTWHGNRGESESSALSYANLTGKDVLYFFAPVYLSSARHQNVFIVSPEVPEQSAKRFKLAPKSLREEALSL